MQVQDLFVFRVKPPASARRHAERKSGEIATYYLDCSLLGKVPSFTYQIKKGWSDIRIGRILFEKEGLNELLQ